MISAPVSRSLRLGSHTRPRRCNSCLFTGAFVMEVWLSGLRQCLLKLGGTPQVRILSLPFKEFSSGIEQRIPNPWTVV